MLEVVGDSENRNETLKDALRRDFILLGQWVQGSKIGGLDCNMHTAKQLAKAILVAFGGIVILAAFLRLLGAIFGS